MSVPRFWREIPQRYNLQASHCGVCQAVHYPPRSICPACRRDSIGKMGRRNLSGEGKVMEWTRVHRPAPGYGLQVPYVVALIQTVEGPLVFGQVVEGDVEEGTSVRATFRRIGEDGDSGIIHYGVKWRPVADLPGDRDGGEEE